MSNIPLSKVRRAAGLVFLSGELPFAPDGSVPEGIGAQTELVLSRIGDTLKGEGLTLNDVVSVLVHLTDTQDFMPFNEVYARHFSEPRPTRTTVCAKLMSDAVKVEITVVAAARN